MLVVAFAPSPPWELVIPQQGEALGDGDFYGVVQQSGCIVEQIGFEGKYCCLLFCRFHRGEWLQRVERKRWHGLDLNLCLWFFIKLEMRDIDTNPCCQTQCRHVVSDDEAVGITIVETLQSPLLGLGGYVGVHDFHDAVSILQVIVRIEFLVEPLPVLAHGVEMDVLWLQRTAVGQVGDDEVFGCLCTFLR